MDIGRARQFLLHNHAVRRECWPARVRLEYDRKNKDIVIVDDVSRKSTVISGEEFLAIDWTLFFEEDKK